MARLLFVRVHIGRGQDPCISEQARRTRRTPTAGGVDGVKTVRRARARRTRRTPTASGIDGVKMVGRARGVKTVGRAGGNGTSSLLGLSSFAGAAHAKDANGQWSRRCEDGVAQAHDADGQWNRRCEDGGTRERVLFIGTQFARGVKTVGCAGSSAASKAAPSGVPWTRWRGP